MRKISNITPVNWDDRKIVWINQVKLPWKEEWVESTSIARLAKAIKRLEIRGAPAIGVAAAFGIAMSACNGGNDAKKLLRSVRKDAGVLGKTRPTAVNLFWAIDRMLKRLQQLEANRSTADDIRDALIKEALMIQKEDIESDRAMAKFGGRLISDGDVILTHCNAGALATAGYGTSYGIIRTAWQEGKDIKVIATQTAPLYQGARLTVWELTRDRIPVTLITDSMAAYAMKNAGVTKVMVGADRILMNGEVANKIGTYGLAVLAKHHGVPFYVAAPTSTIDQKSKTIPIEQRPQEEVRRVLGKLLITVPDVPTLNPAFDITPNNLVSAIITERGVAHQPYLKSLAKLMSSKS